MSLYSEATSNRVLSDLLLVNLFIVNEDNILAHFRIKLQQLILCVQLRRNKLERVSVSFL